MQGAISLSVIVKVLEAEVTLSKESRMVENGQLGQAVLQFMIAGLLNAHPCSYLCIDFDTVIVVSPLLGTKLHQQLLLKAWCNAANHILSNDLQTQQ